MKKRICILLAAVMLMCIFAGCNQGTEPDTQPNAQEGNASEFISDNEIFTYEKIDKSKTQVVVSRTGNINIESFCDAFEKNNPDVQLIVLDITGGTAGVTPIIDWVIKDNTPDIVFSTSGFFSDELLIEHFVNLSANPIIENYEVAALQRTATQANVYLLPGPSNITAMTYNKTLFAEHGWEVPASFDEFVALCVQINEETNGEIEAWNPNAKYSNELMVALEGFCYEEVFAGVDDYEWYDRFIEGKDTFAGHMEPFYKVIQTLVDNNILREEHFTYSATTRSNEFRTGKIAMINGAISNLDNDEYDFGYIAFPSTKGGLGYVNDTYSCFVGIPDKEHTQKQTEAINRFLDYFSTPQGQEDFIGNALKVSNVKDTKLNSSDDLAALQPVIDRGQMFAVADFFGAVTGTIDFRQDALDITTGAKTAAECIAQADTPSDETEVEDNVEPKIISTAPKDMTILETSFYIADTYREKSGADIALITNNIAFRGNLMKIFAGDITEAFVTVLKPRSFENNTKLVKVSMTGQQLLNALNTPPDYNDAPANCIYAYSGLKCEVNAWKELGSKYISVALADGTPIDTQKLYTVAVWQGTVAEEFITETLETYEGTWEEIMMERMRSADSVTFVNDGRITLVWE